MIPEDRKVFSLFSLPLCLPFPFRCWIPFPRVQEHLPAQLPWIPGLVLPAGAPGTAWQRRGVPGSSLVPAVLAVTVSLGQWHIHILSWHRRQAAEF